MTSLLLALSLPCLVWSAGIETAPALKEAGVVRVCVPPETADPWRAAGFDVTPLSQADLAAREAMPVPGITSQNGVASPTRSPFITANGWRFRRARGSKTAYAYDVPAGRGSMAIAEAFAYGADAAVKIDPADAKDAGTLLTFLATVPPADMPDSADIGVVDDGSPEAGEVMNLLSRRNLLYDNIKQPTARHYGVVVKLGTPEFPRADAANPSTFALKVRHKLTDDARSLRVYGSEAVIARLTGEKDRLRLHLVNYGGRIIEGLRIRVNGNFREDAAYVAGTGKVSLADITHAGGATEFSVPSMGVYAVIDLIGEPSARK
jgi:hypothetical protein